MPHISWSRACSSEVVAERYLALLTPLAKDATFLPALEESLAKIAVASQLLDDVNDWRQDLDHRHWTHFLGRLESEERAVSDPWPTATRIEERIRVDW